MINFNFDEFVLDINDNDLKGRDRLGPALSATDGAPKFMQPGLHEVEIISSEIAGACRGDESWIKLQLVLQNPAGSTIRSLVMLPTKKLTYGDGKSSFMAAKTCRFLEAVGFQCSKTAEIPEALRKLFKDVGLLRGFRFSAKIGYEKTAKDRDSGAYKPNMHISYKDKSFSINDYSEKEVATGFATRDAATAHFLSEYSSSHALSAFPDVVSVSRLEGHTNNMALFEDNKATIQKKSLKDFFNK